MRAALTLTFALLAGSASATETTFYTGPSGQPLGSADQFGPMTIYSDAAGREIATSNKFGPIKEWTGPAGEYLGSSVTFGQPEGERE